MTNLVYWYGAYNEPNYAYSFVTSKNLFTHEEGIKKGWDQVPKKVRAKLDKNQKLTSTEAQLVLGLEEMKEDILKPKEARFGRMKDDFPEAYDILTDAEFESNENADDEDEFSP